MPVATKDPIPNADGRAERKLLRAADFFSALLRGQSCTPKHSHDEGGVAWGRIASLIETF